MKRLGSLLTTLVKLDKEIDEDYCLEFLKDEYYNTSETYLFNEIGKFEDIIRNNNKKFFCIISYTEFINNKFYYTNEKQIIQIFIPIKDREIYDIFIQNDLPSNVFSHYDSEIIYEKFIEEKFNFFRKLRANENRDNNYNKKKELVVYLNKNIMKEINDHNNQKQTSGNQINNSKMKEKLNALQEKQIQSKAFSMKNKENINDKLINFENINTIPNSVNSTVCYQKPFINNSEKNKESRKSPLIYKDINQFNNQNKANLINLSPDNLINDFNDFLIKTKIENIIDYESSSSITDQTQSNKINIFCEDTASELITPNEITNVFNKNYHKLSDEKKRNCVNKTNENININSNKENKIIDINQNYLLKEKNINNKSQENTEKNINKIPIDSVYVQPITKGNEAFNTKQKEKNKEFYDINKSFFKEEEEEKKINKTIYNEKSKLINKLTTNDKIENLISKLSNKKSLENLTLSIIRKSDDTREKNFISNFEDQNLITNDNVINQVIEELDSGIFQSNPSKKSNENEKNQAKNNFGNHKNNNNYANKNHLADNNNDQDNYENNNFNIKHKRKYERKNQINFKSKIYEKDKFIEYEIYINDDKYEIKIDASFDDSEYNKLHKKKDGTLDMRRKENKEYLLKLIQNKV